MNKLEELKMSILKCEQSYVLFIEASMYESTSQAVLFKEKYDKEKWGRDRMTNELLPQLIAVAEVAQNVCHHDFSVSDLDGDLILDMRHLQTAIEPLTKDADK